MNKPMWFNNKIVSIRYGIIAIMHTIKKSNLMFFVIAMVFFFSLTSLWENQTTSYAHAYSGGALKEGRTSILLLEKHNKFFENKTGTKSQIARPLRADDNAPIIKENIEQVNIANSRKTSNKISLFEEQSSLDGEKIAMSGFNIKKIVSQSDAERQLSEKLYEIVGDAPIKEMVPFISKRDERVAAFLVGIAKKESSFGIASPLKDGETCYNYWGYKGIGGRGVGMGYACFASAEEAIKIVGDRIEVLVNKQRNTPARMVDTWKCGTSCKGDPGAPSWVATVTLYFDKILG